jgi:tetratricopeptide (TPR) repeat protein
MGRVYYIRGDYPLAEKEFEKTIQLDRSFVRAYDNLGLTHQALGNNEAAIEHFRKAIRLCEEKGLRREWPYINLGTLYNRLRDPQQALQNAEMAAKINPHADEAYFQMAKAYLSMSDWDKAAEALLKAIEIEPNSFEYHYTLSQAYRKAGKIEAGEREIAICLKLRSNSQSTKGEGPASGSPHAK